MKYIDKIGFVKIESNESLLSKEEIQKLVEWCKTLPFLLRDFNLYIVVNGVKFNIENIGDKIK